ncbi:PE-PPE domain-containing protein [Mycolicibacterium sp. 018/SC-01/001]|uniref:PE-PPE domain-containing protein n=1 Tax=Mycolicibacterium sp. 018/SC-01/001 TaxID=2592069 RepID=UPI0021031EFA|nr:PE-PPE domain-containing protein [Mycolicibacterium sp. 018/SC-01/001]
MTAVGMAGVAVAGAAMLGTVPTMSVSPQLMSTLHYLRGTTNGHQATQQEFEDFITAVVDGAQAPATDGAYKKVDYNAGFWPISAGGFKDLKFDDSVAEGVANLTTANPARGDVIFGFSQGAVVASTYKATHEGNTYILVSNPNRPNGGILQRFQGLHIPILDVTFDGATPDNGDPTIDVTRQYDGWADFPTYLWNPLAIANAIAGMALVHGNTQFVLTADDLEKARESGDSDYYQVDEKTNTTYYVVRTYPIPLLMPLDPFLPDPVIAALDAPLRKIIETAYDRSDYGAPTRATIFPRRAPQPEVAPVEKPDVQVEQEQRRTPEPRERDVDRDQDQGTKRSSWQPGKQLREALQEANATRHEKRTARQERDASSSKDDAKAEDAPKKVQAPSDDSKADGPAAKGEAA